ncbi:MAG: AAA family ATPase [Pseudolabrys sp.]
MSGSSPSFFVITGGPGSGKTTLIQALAAAGYATQPEAGRRIIRQQQETGGRALPWIDPLAFAKTMLVYDLESYAGAGNLPRPVFFDRGIPDIVGYLRLEGIPVPAPVLQAANSHRYQPHVFICPPWPAIYAADNERKQTPVVAERTYEAMVEVYTALDYMLIEIPRVPAAERVRFVQDFLRDNAGAPP